VPCEADPQVASPPKPRGRRSEVPASGTGAVVAQTRCHRIAVRVAPVLADALATLRERGIVEEAFQPLRAALVSVLLAAGETEAARQCFADGEHEPTASPSVLAARARIAALLVERDVLPADAAVAKDLSPAPAPSLPPKAHRRAALRRPAPDPREAYERALTLLTPACDPFETARTRLAYGVWLQRVRRLDDARPHLDQAAAEFRRLGADGWAARVDAEVAAALRAVREAGAAERFSDREREIARLIAAGMTDKQAAAALFLSPRTIEYHLRSLYRKLGIRKRTQLAAIVAEWGGL
jgi:DNA-binding CsgD family transcriptional regulator